jgi:hypothetical protein
MVPPNDTLRLVRVDEDMEADGTWYAWTERGTSEARSSEPSKQGLKNQSLFLRGFKLTFSPDFYASLRGEDRSTPKPPGSEDAWDSSGPSGSHDRDTTNGNDNNGSSEPSNVAQREGGGGGMDTTRQQQSFSDIQVEAFPENRAEVS